MIGTYAVDRPFGKPGAANTKLQAFETIALPLMDQIYRTAYTMTKNHFEAEDLTQEAYLRAWRFYDKFEIGSNFRAWIFRILTNTFINQYRRKKRVTFLEILENDGADEIVDFMEPVQVDSLAGQNYDEMFDDTVAAALDDVPEHYRMVVLLTDVSELSYKETAAVLDCPIGTVMSRLHRGRKLLASQLKNYALENGYVTN